MNNNLLEYKGYHAKIEIDTEDKLFIGTVIGINDYLVFHGENYNELQKMFEQSIDNYLQMCAEMGIEPDKEYKGTFNVRISPELHKKADLRAKSEKTTLNQLIGNAIEQYINNNVQQTSKEIYFLPMETIGIMNNIAENKNNCKKSYDTTVWEGPIDAKCN